MPCLRQTSGTVRPLARSRSASRRRRWICSAVRRLPMNPSLDSDGTSITTGPNYGEPLTPAFDAMRERKDTLIKMLGDLRRMADLQASNEDASSEVREELLFGRF